MAEHKIKSWKHLFEPVYNGDKTHDLRVMDRDYNIGDTLILQEYDWVTKEYTGREVKVEVTYITGVDHVQCAFSPFVLDNRFGILSIKKV